MGRPGALGTKNVRRGLSSRRDTARRVGRRVGDVVPRPSRARGPAGRRCQLSLPAELRRSDREAEGGEEREHLRRDAVERAGDDADDGIEQAAGEGNTHVSTSF